jgi:hypothetical protein
VLTQGLNRLVVAIASSRLLVSSAQMIDLGMNSVYAFSISTGLTKSDIASENSS